jgi:DNA-binding FadR family transcriptional regulator
MGKKNALTQIKPINTSTLVDKVELRLWEYFEENNLKPGDALPKELDLSRELGVSRTVVREAFSRLRTLGFVDSRKNRGMVLTRPDVLSSFEKVLNPKILSHSTLQDIFEWRMVLEIGLADLIFSRKSDTDIQELEEIVDRAEQEEGVVAGFNALHEMEFHGKLYEMSGNDTLRRFQGMLFPVFKYVIDHGLFIKDYPYPEGYVTHRRLFEIIKKGTSREFAIAMQDHLKPSMDRILGFSTSNNLEEQTG